MQIYDIFYLITCESIIFIFGVILRAFPGIFLLKHVNLISFCFSLLALISSGINYWLLDGIDDISYISGIAGIREMGLYISGFLFLLFTWADVRYLEGKTGRYWEKYEKIEKKMVKDRVYYKNKVWNLCIYFFYAVFPITLMIATCHEHTYKAFYRLVGGPLVLCISSIGPKVKIVYEKSRRREIIINYFFQILVFFMLTMGFLMCLGFMDNAVID